MLIREALVGDGRFDLKNSLDYGRSISEIAQFPCRDEDEVRERMRERGLKGQKRKAA
jgi:hypothetical protein